MSDVVKVVEEEFDDEGNLTRRITTEYGPEPAKINLNPAGIRVGDVWPYTGITGISTTSAERYLVNNGYDQGTYARHAPGGTDRDRTGAVVE